MSSRQYRFLREMTLGLAAVVVIGIAVAAAVLSAHAVTSRGATDAPHYVAAGSAMRMLVVGPAGSDEVTSPPGPLRASLMMGTIPDHPTMATVLSDENCAADGEGVSHCVNRLRLSDGRMLTVRHNHRMADTPCLSPGEQVQVTGA